MSGQTPQAIGPWTDAPLKDPKQDLLARKPFVSMIVDLLVNLTDSNDSSVVGLAGPWGSGKSTLINFLRPELSKHIKVVTFSPWSAEGSHDIQREFFASLLEAFPKGSHRSVRKNVKKIIRRGSTLLRSVPMGLGNGFAEFAKETLPEESWDKAFTRLSRAINEAGAKILVVIDDVDRLQPDEIVTLMKMVRLTGRFPRTNYLLSYDHDSLVTTLAAGLKTDNRRTAEAYLEKIVQYPLSLPPAQRTHLQSIVFNEVSSVLSSFGGVYATSPAKRFQDFYTEHMWNTLVTPRACHRFCAQAKTYLALTENEVDHADFLAITFLRIHHPKVYTEMRKWKDRIVGAQSTVAAIQDRPKAEQEWDEIIRHCGYDEHAERVEIRRAIAALFPKVAGDLGIRADSGGNYRIYDANYFERFFTFSLPAGDVSDQLILQQIKGLRSGAVSFAYSLVDTFDHPDVDTQMLATQKGDLHSEGSHIEPSINLVKFVAGSLARNPIDFNEPLSVGRLKMNWLARLIDDDLPFTSGDVDYIVGLFPTPALLGSAIRRSLNIYYPYGKADARELDEQEFKEEPPSFLKQLADAWALHASIWIVNFLTKEEYSTPDREFLEVWSCMEFLDQISLVRPIITQKVESEDFDLVTVAGHFAFRGTFQNDHFYFGGNGDEVGELDVAKLSVILSEELLRTLPLSTVEADRPGDTIARLRRRRAIEGLNKLRGNT